MTLHQPNLRNFREKLLDKVLQGDPRQPFSYDQFRLAFLVLGNTPICSGLVRFAQLSSESFSEQIRTDQGNLFLLTPF